MEGGCGLFCLQVEGCSERGQGNQRPGRKVHLHFLWFNLQQLPRKSQTPRQIRKHWHRGRMSQTEKSPKEERQVWIRKFCLYDNRISSNAKSISRSEAAYPAIAWDCRTWSARMTIPIDSGQLWNGSREVMSILFPCPLKISKNHYRLSILLMSVGLSFSSLMNQTPKAISSTWLISRLQLWKNWSESL